MVFFPAFDFSTRSSTADSHPVKIDSTPPETSERPIEIDGRHLSNLSEINAWYLCLSIMLNYSLIFIYIHMFSY